MSGQSDFIIPKSEFCALLGEFGPSIVIGLMVPIQGPKSRDAAITMGGNSIRRLTQLGIIDNSWPRQGSPKNKLFHSILKSISHPMHTVLVTLGINDAKEKTRTFHYNQEKSVVSVEELTSKDISISMLRPHQAVEFINSTFAEETILATAEGSAPLELRESLVRSVRALVQNKESKSALKALIGAGIPETLAGELLAALTKPKVRMGIAVFLNRNQSGHPVRSIGMLADRKQHAWTVEASNRESNAAVIRQVSKVSLFERIKTILPE
jgi:hypothetical protein